MAHDLVNNVRVASALNGATITTGTTNGIAIDGRGFDSHMFVVSNSAYTDGTFTLTVEESDASGSGYAAIAASQYQNTTTTITSANQRRKVGFTLTKRYYRLVVTAASAATGSHFSASVVQGNASSKPVA